MYWEDNSIKIVMKPMIKYSNFKQYNFLKVGHFF